MGRNTKSTGKNTDDTSRNHSRALRKVGRSELAAEARPRRLPLRLPQLLLEPTAGEAQLVQLPPPALAFHHRAGAQSQRRGLSLLPMPWMRDALLERLAAANPFASRCRSSLLALPSPPNHSSAAEMPCANAHTHTSSSADATDVDTSTASAAQSSKQLPPEAPSQKEADAPKETAPTERAPAERAPAERAPTDRAPTDRAPTDRAPAERAPAERTPAERAPAERAPAERAPAERAPAERAPAEMVPEQSPEQVTRLLRWEYPDSTNAKREIANQSEGASEPAGCARGATQSTAQGTAPGGAAARKGRRQTTEATLRDALEKVSSEILYIMNSLQEAKAKAQLTEQTQANESLNMYAQARIRILEKQSVKEKGKKQWEGQQKSKAEAKAKAKEADGKAKQKATAAIKAKVVETKPRVPDAKQKLGQTKARVVEAWPKSTESKTKIANTRTETARLKAKTESKTKLPASGTQTEAKEKEEAKVGTAEEGEGGVAPRVAVSLSDGQASWPLPIANWHLSALGQLVLSCSLPQGRHGAPAEPQLQEKVSSPFKNLEKDVQSTVSNAENLKEFEHPICQTSFKTFATRVQQMQAKQAPSSEQAYTPAAVPTTALSAPASPTAIPPAVQVPTQSMSAQALQASLSQQLARVHSTSAVTMRTIFPTASLSPNSPEAPLLLACPLRTQTATAAEKIPASRTLPVQIPKSVLLTRASGAALEPQAAAPAGMKGFLVHTQSIRAPSAVTALPVSMSNQHPLQSPFTRSQGAADRLTAGSTPIDPSRAEVSMVSENGRLRFVRFQRGKVCQQPGALSTVPNQQPSANKFNLQKDTSHAAVREQEPSSTQRRTNGQTQSARHLLPPSILKRSQGPLAPVGRSNRKREAGAPGRVKHAVAGVSTARKRPAVATRRGLKSPTTLRNIKPRTNKLRRKRTAFTANRSASETLLDALFGAEKPPPRKKGRCRRAKESSDKRFRKSTTSLMGVNAKPGSHHSLSPESTDAHKKRVASGKLAERRKRAAAAAKEPRAEEGVARKRRPAEEGRERSATSARKKRASGRRREVESPSDAKRLLGNAQRDHKTRATAPATPCKKTAGAKQRAPKQPPGISLRQIKEALAERQIHNILLGNDKPPKRLDTDSLLAKIDEQSNKKTVTEWWNDQSTRRATSPVGREQPSAPERASSVREPSLEGSERAEKPVLIGSSLARDSSPAKVAAKSGRSEDPPLPQSRPCGVFRQWSLLRKMRSALMAPLSCLKARHSLGSPPEGGRSHFVQYPFDIVEARGTAGDVGKPQTTPVP